MHGWAGQLGIAAETLSRALSDLIAEGLVERDGRAFRLVGRP
jgi:predicted ArsR family transcriptional regulator